MGSKFKIILTWTLSIIGAVLFLLAGSGKFSFSGNLYDNFIDWGYNGTILILVGISEVLGGILLLWPARRGYGIFLLSAVMLGAIVTHLLNFQDLGWPLFPFLILMGLTVLYFINKK